MTGKLKHGMGMRDKSSLKYIKHNLYTMCVRVQECYSSLIKQNVVLCHFEIPYCTFIQLNCMNCDTHKYVCVFVFHDEDD